MLFLEEFLKYPYHGSYIQQESDIIDNIYSFKKISGRGGGGVMNWEIGIDIYTLICIKCITNKKLLYKKINKIKKQNKSKKISYKRD